MEGRNATVLGPAPDMRKVQFKQSRLQESDGIPGNREIRLADFELQALQHITTKSP